MSAVDSIILLPLTMRPSFILTALLLALPAQAEIALSEKHLIILRAGIDSVWGDYIFSVQNNQSEPQQAEVALFLPHEATDFKAVEGVTDDDMRIDAQHSTVMLHKEFPHGTTLVNVAFKVTAHAGKARLSWQARQPIASLNVMYEHDVIEVFSEQLEGTHLPRIADVHYRALHTPQGLAKGDSLQVQVQGIPQGRGQLHLFAVVFAVLLLILSVYGGIRTRPRGEGRIGT